MSGRRRHRRCGPPCPCSSRSPRHPSPAAPPGGCGATLPGRGRRHTHRTRSGPRRRGTRVGPQRYPELMAEDQVLERKVPARANRSPEGMKSQQKQLEHPPGWHPPSTRIAFSRPSTLLAHRCHLLGGLTMSDCQSGCRSARWLGRAGIRRQRSNSYWKTWRS